MPVTAYPVEFAPQDLSVDYLSARFCTPRSMGRLALRETKRSQSGRLSLPCFCGPQTALTDLLYPLYLNRYPVAKTVTVALSLHLAAERLRRVAGSATRAQRPNSRP